MANKDLTVTMTAINGYGMRSHLRVWPELLSQLWAFLLCFTHRASCFCFDFSTLARLLDSKLSNDP